MEDITKGLIEQPKSDDSVLLELIERYRIKAHEQYAEKEYLLERDGVGFSPRGNVMALSAEKKAGKTWFGMAMCAALLKGEYLGMKARKDDCRVVFFDTEQDEGDGQRIQRRVHYACGWDFEIDNDRFMIFHLREADAAERRKVVCSIIELMKPDMVIVDGIRDLLTDFNDLEQSASVIQDFMRLSSECKCAIWAVLHVNPNSEKMRGHLGTELGNKVADILHMTKTKNPNDEDDVTYKMEEVAARSHQDIHSITFRIDDRKPYGAPMMIGKVEAKQIEEDAKSELYALMKRYIPSPHSASTTKLQKLIKDGEHIGSAKAYKMIQDAAKAGVIDKAINDRWIVTERPITKTEELPFGKQEEDVPY